MATSLGTSLGTNAVVVMGVRCLMFHRNSCINANSVENDQKPHSVTSDRSALFANYTIGMGVGCVGGVTRLKWVNLHSSKRTYLV